MRPEYGLIDLNDKELNDIQDRLKGLSNKYLGESVGIQVNMIYNHYQELQQGITSD